MCGRVRGLWVGRWNVVPLSWSNVMHAVEYVVYNCINHMWGEHVFDHYYNESAFYDFRPSECYWIVSGPFPWLKSHLY
jgi:hypothetical protein